MLVFAALNYFDISDLADLLLIEDRQEEGQFEIDDKQSEICARNIICPDYISLLGDGSLTRRFYFLIW